MANPRRGLNIRGNGYIRELETDFLSLHGQQMEYDRPGNHWYVDAYAGGASYNGKSWSRPFLTMTQAFAVVESGDTIHFTGKIREQLTTPVQVFDVTIRGEGNRPRHADAAPTPIGRQAAATWTTPASGSTDNPLLKVIQQGWRIENFVMAGHATDACVQLLRNAGADDAERDASHFEAIGMRFASGQDGIENVGGCYNVGIYDCTFHDLTGYAIKGGTSTAVAAPYRWQIRRNRFQGCGNWIGAWNGNSCEIRDNVIASTTTALLDTSGGDGHNIIVGNMFDIAAADFDPVGLVVGHSTDVWSNVLKNAIETGLPAN